MPKHFLKYPKLSLIILAVFVSGYFLLFNPFSEKLNDRPNSQIYAYPLPDFLQEISGIAYFAQNKVACVQDEQGAVFIYDLDKKDVTEKIDFGPPGDYEGVALANNNFYILRSDGLLYEVKNYQEKPETAEYNLEIAAKNNEGLSFDRNNNRLLISAKSKVEAGKEYKDQRYIYSFDLQRKKLEPNPILIIDIGLVEEYISNTGLDLEAKNKKAKKIIKFRPSDLAVHPLTNNIYIISSIDNLLVVFDQQGKILSARQLDISLFNQPEGIAFAENGDILIASEGGAGRPALLKFNLDIFEK